MGFTVIEFDVAEVFHAYVPPPVAVNVVDCPSQIVAVPLIAAVGGAATVTVMVSVAEQLPVVPVTVYRPDAAVVAMVMEGFCNVLVNEFGPVHE